ncbi:hypothetical protein [Candidatus Amarolinea aalborgensis]|jgi:hypothetical protein|uniref:hypothetical protein n=1 Tax=Candidatus Amarolinea aalborgensis TaxID=2249329 RepID=UPI003BF944CB
MNQTQQQVYVEVWRTATALVDAVNRMDQRSAQRQVALRSRLDTLLDVYGIGALVPLFYAHVSGGGHYPRRFATLSSSEALLELGRCRDMEAPLESTFAHVSLHLRRHGRQPWLAVDVRPLSLDAMLDRAECEQSLIAGEGDTLVLKLLTGRLYMKPRRQASLDPVEARLIEEMPKTHFSLPEQVCALLLWRDFQHEEGKLDTTAILAWAATVQHVIGVLNGHSLSSARAAAQYDVDPGLVRNLRQHLMQTVKLTNSAERYTVFDYAPATEFKGAAKAAA